MGSRRSRKLKARDTFDLEKAFARIKAEREGRPTREEAPKPSPVEKPKNKEEREITKKNNTI